jgi:AcrR family transcriptional regulator
MDGVSTEIGTPPPVRLELPMHDGSVRERADAARNRAKVLAAAAELFDRHGVSNVSMDAIAAAAGVGKGTLFRRFGDRSGLALALLDEHERDLQERVLRGPPPLGPGAPPAERLEAFLHAIVDMLDRHAELLLAAELGAPHARFVTPVYAAWRQHVALLVSEARPDADVAVLTHVLLAPLSAALFMHLCGDQGVEPDRLKASLGELARAMVG